MKFKESLDWKRIFSCFMADILLYAIIFLLFFALSAYVEQNTSELEKITSKISYVTASLYLDEPVTQDVDKIYSDFKSLTTGVLVAYVIFFLLSIGMLLYFKSLIWSWVAGKKLSLRLFGRFVFGNIIWYASWLLLLLILSITTLPVAILSRVILVLMGYLSLLFLANVYRKGNVFYLVRKSFLHGLNFFRFILVLALVYLSFVAGYYVIFMQFYLLLPLVVLTVAWLRIFVYNSLTD